MRVHHSPLEVGLQRQKLCALHRSKERRQFSLLARCEIRSLTLNGSHLIEQAGGHGLVRRIASRDLLPQRPARLHLPPHERTTLRFVALVNLLQPRSLLAGETETLANNLGEPCAQALLHLGTLLGRTAPLRRVTGLGERRRGGQ